MALPREAPKFNEINEVAKRFGDSTPIDPHSVFETVPKPPDPENENPAAGGTARGADRISKFNTRNMQQQARRVYRDDPLKDAPHYTVEPDIGGWFMCDPKGGDAFRRFLGRTFPEAMRAVREIAPSGVPGLVIGGAHA